LGSRAVIALTGGSLTALLLLLARAKAVPPPPPEACAELIRNGDFLEGMRYWSYWEEPPGTRCHPWGPTIRIYSPTWRVGKSCLYQLIELSPATRTIDLEAGLWLWRENPAYPVPFTIKIWDGSFDPQKPPLYERTWEGVSGTFKRVTDRVTIANAEPQVTFGFWFEDARSDEWFVWYADKASLHVEVPAEAPPARRIWPWILAPILAGSTKIAVSR